MVSVVAGCTLQISDLCENIPMNPSSGLCNQAHRSFCSDALLCALLFFFIFITVPSYGRCSLSSFLEISVQGSPLDHVDAKGSRPEWYVLNGDLTSHYNVAPPPPAARASLLHWQTSSSGSTLGISNVCIRTQPIIWLTAGSRDIWVQFDTNSKCCAPSSVSPSLLFFFFLKALPLALQFAFSCSGQGMNIPSRSSARTAKQT